LDASHAVKALIFWWNGAQKSITSRRNIEFTRMSRKAWHSNTKGEALVLRFFCPTAQQHFDSGVLMDDATYARQRLNIIAVACPHCERQHRFLLADAEFRAEEYAA
jgi:hypothetical protein